MDINIAGYEITVKLHESSHTLIYRGHRTRDSQPVVLKVLKPQVSMADWLVGFRREFEITSHLNLPGVIKVYGLEPYQDSLMIVLEDIAGQSLDHPLEQGPVGLARFLELAIGLADILGSIHQQRVIHKDINPSNIVVNSKTGQLRLIDFGLADELPQRSIGLQPPAALEGTLAYLSPEQTGRMNRLVDYRTDFYSLGVTFYQMLTGILPFEAEDALGVVHCHIAKIATAPHEVDSAIPPMVSEIVMKLMAKMAEDRYQSAWGLKADLERCRHQQTTAGIIPPFELGQEDVSDRFQIPQKLYGREKEIEQLLAAFDRASAGGRELFLVAGYAGVGKTSLVHEIYKPITEKRGYFIEGKFDQLQRNIPYFGWMQAFRGLVHYLLMENEEQLAAWKQIILAAVGESGQVLTDVVPHLELVIGPQPAVPELSPAGAQFRFNHVFEKFIQVVATGKHPLVVFLDDLQWIDPASLKLLEYIITYPDTKYLLLIGAYRDNEVSPAHLLPLALDNIRKSVAGSQVISLSPLSPEDLGHLTTDTFDSDQARVGPLTGLLYDKTAGNPFFVNQFLITLYDERLVEFDRTERFWQWDMARIKAKGYTDNVADLMVGKLRKLSERTLQEMRLAACIGNRFDLHTLAVISSSSDEEIRESLEEALREGLVFHLTDTAHTFLHDRVQQAAYSLIPETQRAELHLRIGRLLFAQKSDGVLEEQVFDVVSHLNRGAALLVDQEEKYRAAGLNLMAGQKAKASTAYASATGFYSAGIALLAPDSGEAQHELAFALHAGLAECTYLKGDLDEAKNFCDSVLAYAQTNAERVRMYLLKIDLLTTKGEILSALESGVECLHMLGLDIPLSPTAEQVRAEDELFEKLMGNRQIEDLLDLPDCTDPDISAALEILTVMHPSSHFIPDPNLYLLIPTLITNISLRHGNAPASAMGYGTYGLLLTTRRKPGDAYRFGKVACNLVERFNSVAYRSKVYFIMGGVISQFFEPISIAQEYLDRCFQTAVEVGDIPFACFARVDILLHTFIKGDPLDEVYSEAEQCLDFARKVKFEMIVTLTVCEQRLIQALRGQTLHVGSFEDATFSETAFEEQVKGNIHDFCWYQISKLQSRFFAGDYAAALLSLNELKDRQFLILGEPVSIEYYFFAALTLATCYPQASAEEKPALEQILKEYLQKLEIWARSCPETFQNRYALVQAEVARIEGRDLEAMPLYEEAIHSARENGFVQNESLACELAAKFWLSRGYQDFARLYITKAHQGYARWQAWGKTRALEAQYPHWLVKKTEQHPTKKSSSHPGEQVLLDVNTVMKATQAISSEIELDRLLSRMMQLVMENAGAQKGCLVLERDDQWIIAAEGNANQGQGASSPLVSMDKSHALSAGVVHYVARTKRSIILDDAAHQGEFITDPHIRQQKIKSLLCAPLLSQGRLIGILYLENNLTTHAFTSERVQLLEILLSQAAISLENAQVYAALREREEALRESEEKYRRIVDTANEGIWVLDQDHRTTFVNARMAEMLGYSMEEMIGQRLEAFLFDEDLPDHAKKMEARRQGLAEQYERRFRSNEGQTVWVIFQQHPSLMPNIVSTAPLAC